MGNFGRQYFQRTRNCGDALMATLRWAVCCQRAIVDSATQSLSLIDHLERITLPHAPPPENGARPLLPLKFCLVAIWDRSKPELAERGEMRVRLLGPNGDELGQATSPIDLVSGSSARNFVNLPGLPLAGAGRYAFEVCQRSDDGWHEESARPHFDVVYSPNVAPTKHPTKQTIPKRRSAAKSK